MSEIRARLDVESLHGAFRAEGVDGLRSAIAFGRASFGNKTWDAVAIDGGINENGELDEDRRRLYEGIEAKLDARRGEPIFVVGAHRERDEAGYIDCLSMSTGIINPDSEALLRPRKSVVGAEIDTVGHVEFWQYDTVGSTQPYVGVQWLNHHDSGIPTMLHNKFHSIGETVESDHHITETHVFTANQLTKWADETYGGSNMGYMTLATSVEALHQLKAPIRGLFASDTLFIKRAMQELAMLNDITRLFVGYRKGFTFEGEELSDEEQLATRGALRTLVDARLDALRHKHADLLWRLPGPDTCQPFGIVGSRSVDGRLSVLGPQLAAMRELLED